MWQTIGIVAVPVLMVLAGLFRQHKEYSDLKSKVDNIAKEFKPNGGSSMKDDMNTVKSEVKVLNVRFDDHLKQHAGQWR